MVHCMKILLATIVVVLIAGCSKEATAPEAATTSPSAASTASEIAAPEQKSGEPNQIGAAWTPPFPENNNFFSPPAIDALKTLQPLADRKTQDVRVIGFSKLVDGPARVLLSIDGKIELAAAGDAINGIQVLEIAEPSVTLQQQNDRWSLALFDQKADAGVGAPNRHTSHHRSVATAATPHSRPAVLNPPMTPKARIPAGVPSIPTPIDPSTLLNINLPGLTQIPQLPPELR